MHELVEFTLVVLNSSLKLKLASETSGNLKVKNSCAQNLFDCLKYTS